MRIRCGIFALLFAVVPMMGYAQSTSTSFSITDKSASSTITDGSGGATTVGYGRLVPSGGGTIPSGVAIFGYKPGNVLVTEAGVPASPQIKKGRIYAEVGGGGFLGSGTDIGVAIANPGSAAASISFYYTNASGTDTNGVAFSLPAGQQQAVFLDQSPWNIPLGFQGTVTFTSTVPISVVALQLYNNARGEALITTLPVVDLDAGAAPTSTTPAVLSQFADGVGWTTSVLLVNPTDSSITGTVQFLAGATGSALSLTANSSTSTSFSYTIPTHSSYKVLTAGASSTVQTGSVVVTPSGGTVTPVSLGVFSYNNGTTIVTQAGVPSMLGTSFRTYVAATTGFGSTGSYSTGFAVANASSTAGTINLDLFTPDGNPTSFSATLPIAANGQFAKFLTDVFPTITLPFQGLLRIRTSTSAISVVSLRIRFNERGEFLETTTPPTEENGTAPTGEYDFPQIANGGGFTTQFVLFSGYKGQATSGTLSFVASNASPLSLNTTSTIQGTAPTLASIAPATAAVGSTVTLTGTGFSASSVVTFTTAAGPTPVTPATQTATSITAVVPANAISGPVQVANGSLTSGVVILQVTTSGGAQVQASVTVSAGATATGADIYVPAPAAGLTFTGLGVGPAGATAVAYTAASAIVPRGQTMTMLVVGTGLTSTTGVSISGSGVTLSNFNYSVVSQGGIFLNIAVAAGATPGFRNVVLTNSNGDTSIMSGGLLIQ